jgi:hypothetical protein
VSRPSPHQDATRRRAIAHRGGQWGIALLLLSIVWAWQGAVQAWGDDNGPTLVKTGIQLQISQRGIYRPAGAPVQEDTTCWAPILKFEVRGPVTAGGQFSVDFTKPDGSPWLHFDVPTEEIKAGHAVKMQTPDEGGLDPVEGKFTRAVGVYGFSIHYKNALEGTHLTLFTGKFTVGKVSESLGIPKMKNVYNFYVDYDWTLPIGYVWLPAKSDRFDNPPLTVSLWFRGDTDGAGLEAHLFYQDKEVAVAQGSDSEVGHNTATGEKGDPRWTLIGFTFYKVLENAAENVPTAFSLDKNPGEYEVKVLRDGKLSRDLKFTAGDGGQIVDTGIVAANHLGTKRVLVPVKVLGTGDGAYNKAAWQTDAFYGNPLTGFTAP